MKQSQIREYCLGKPGTSEDRPFDLVTIVFRVGGKIFAFLQDQDPVESISLKCDPDHALALRAQYPAVTGGYHLNKKHWNTVRLDGSIPAEEILEMIDESYDLIFTSLPKRVRLDLKGDDLPDSSRQA